MRSKVRLSLILTYLKLKYIPNLPRGVQIKTDSNKSFENRSNPKHNQIPIHFIFGSNNFFSQNRPNVHRKHPKFTTILKTKSKENLRELLKA